MPRNFHSFPEPRFAVPKAAVVMNMLQFAAVVIVTCLVGRLKNCDMSERPTGEYAESWENDCKVIDSHGYSRAHFFRSLAFLSS